MSVFALNPNTEGAKRFIEIKQEEALIEAELSLVRKKRELAKFQADERCLRRNNKSFVILLHDRLLIYIKHLLFLLFTILFPQMLD